MSGKGEIQLIENSIKDADVLENFRRIKVFLRENPILNCGFEFRSFNIPAGLVTNYKFKHNLKFIPRDIFYSLSNDATAIWHYANFDRDFVYLTVSAACRVRAFFGAYKDDTE